MITWTPIEQLPEELKDGREVLLAFDDNDGYTVAWWSKALDAWTDIGDIGLAGLEGITPTHFAEITPP